LLENGYSDFASSRSYYAMFYAVEAVLLSKDMSFSKHKAVISVFGRDFVKTDIFPAKLHHYISKAFNIRQQADYSTLSPVTAETARLLIDQAKELIESIEKYLVDNGYEL